MDFTLIVKLSFLCTGTVPLYITSYYNRGLKVHNIIQDLCMNNKCSIRILKIHITDLVFKFRPLTLKIAIQRQICRSTWTSFCSFCCCCVTSKLQLPQLLLSFKYRISGFFSVTHSTQTLTFINFVQ